MSAIKILAYVTNVCNSKLFLGIEMTKSLQLQCCKWVSVKQMKSAQEQILLQFGNVYMSLRTNNDESSKTGLLGFNDNDDVLQ